MELLTEDGKRIARLYYLATVYSSKIPFQFVRKFIAALLTLPIIMYITNQGAKENARRRKAKVS